MKSDVWPLVHAERQALINDLGHLDDAKWGLPSTLLRMDVHDVVDLLRATAGRP